MNAPTDTLAERPAPWPPGGPWPDDRALQGTRRAASVVLLRDAEGGPQVLLLRRAVRDGDMRSGVWVFPGGVLDAADPTLHDCARGQDAAFSQRMQLPCRGLDYAIAAVRECFEEVGLLLADGPGAALQQAASVRPRLQDGPAFADWVRQAGLVLAVDELVYLAHWLTPLGMKPRFDTRFFLARAPRGRRRWPTPARRWSWPG
jgi:8-oxo-dGTP pyrophosphatase MutT (NUDIX family)